MILIDSSVLIDILEDRRTLQTCRFEELVREGNVIGIGDLMLVEVLQGIRHDRAYRAATGWLSRFDRIDIAGHRVANQAAIHHRYLSDRGVTIRKTIDTLIATRCILSNYPLLYRDRDFDPFVEHLNLRSAMADAGAS